MKAIEKHSTGTPARSSDKPHIEAQRPQQPSGSTPAGVFRATIRSHGARWCATTITAIAQNIGGFTHGEIGRLVLPGTLKRHPRCQLEYETWPAQVGDGVSQFHVVIQLDTCDYSEFTLESVMKSARRMADALGAELVDEAGEPLAGEVEAREAARVDTALSERRKESEIFEELADGTRSRRRLTSFHTERRTKRGRFLEERHFDVPPMEYYQGSIHGYRCMLELLDALNARTSLTNAHRDVEEILKAAAACGRRDFNKVSKGNVAQSVLDIAAHALFFFAQNAHYRRFIERMIEDEERHRELVQDSDAKQKADFVGRMREAKAAKAKAPKAGARPQKEHRHA